MMEIIWKRFSFSICLFYVSQICYKWFELQYTIHDKCMRDKTDKFIQSHNKKTYSNDEFCQSNNERPVSQINAFNVTKNNENKLSYKQKRKQNIFFTSKEKMRLNLRVTKLKGLVICSF